MSRNVVAKDMVLAQTRALKMPGAARVFEALGRQAREEHWSHEEYLHEVLAAEQDVPAIDSAVRQRQRDARFPEVKTLDTFDFTANDGSVTAAQVTELARGGWLDRAENVILAGPIGTGKTHLAIALGLEAVRQRRRVLFVRAADLVRSLIEARDARELEGCRDGCSKPSTCSSSTSWASCPSTAPAASCSFTCSRTDTRSAACSSPRTSPSQSG